MANISQAQAKLLNTNFLDSLAKDDSFTANLDNLPLTQRLLIEAAAVFVQNARDNVQKPKNGRSLISTGALQDSIFASELRVDGNNLEIDLGYRGKGGKYAENAFLALRVTFFNEM